MHSGPRASLLDALNSAGDLSGRSLHGAEASVALADLLRGSSLDTPSEALRGGSVLIATKDQLPAALAMIELDGVARRLVLCTPDLPPEHVAAIVATAEIEAIVSDRAAPSPGIADGAIPVVCSPSLVGREPRLSARAPSVTTEWVLLTSGTTGVPKMAQHSLASLTGAIQPAASAPAPVWSTFYDIRRYGGLQILLRAMLGNGSMVLSSAREATGDFLARAGARGVTHISGTPSHWRRVLMSPAAHAMAPRYVRLSGEIADQAVLDQLRACYPDADIAHAFASTEAGVAFAVGDGLAGLPVGLIDRSGGEVEMKVEDGTLRIRSARTASRYLGAASEPIADSDGFVDTGDMLERRGDRYYFVGRKGGIINVGGRKVHPEEVEAVVNRHPAVRMSLVKARPNPITGAVVAADIVLKTPADEALAQGTEELKRDIIAACRGELAPHKVPVAVRFVSSLAVAPSGKIARRDA
ncbi:MAG: acyl--CoA ligase [Alphaproteobacteria bacterium]|nr:acyl--CoA ligase [Alphaproteobacteria bacterium]